jgi:hypothetical protein
MILDKYLVWSDETPGMKASSQCKCNGMGVIVGDLLTPSHLKLTLWWAIKKNLSL